MGDNGRGAKTCSGEVRTGSEMESSGLDRGLVGGEGLAADGAREDWAYMASR